MIELNFENSTSDLCYSIRGYKIPVSQRYITFLILNSYRSGESYGFITIGVYKISVRRTS